MYSKFRNTLFKLNSRHANHHLLKWLILLCEAVYLLGFYQRKLPEHLSSLVAVAIFANKTACLVSCKSIYLLAFDHCYHHGQPCYNMLYWLWANVPSSHLFSIITSTENWQKRKWLEFCLTKYFFFFECTYIYELYLSNEFLKMLLSFYFYDFWCIL